MAKTSIRLKYAPNVWPVVENWAGENQYVLEAPAETTRLYIRKSDDKSTKISVAISQTGENVRIRSWYSDLLRKELEIDSPSLYAALPRKEALSEIQKLLEALGAIQPDPTKTKGKQNFAFNLGRSIRKLSGKK